MNALEYLKGLGPNILTPNVIRLGFIKPGVAYEVSMDHRGLDGLPIWAVTVAGDLPADDGGTKIGILHDLSKPLKSEKACDDYILGLIQRLDPEGFEDPGEKVGPGNP